MGLKAIYCNSGVLEPTMTKPGERASASSDFSGKDLLTYTVITAAMAAVSGCISSTTTTVTETSKTEVQQHSASEGEGNPTPDVTTTTPVTNHNTTTTPVAAYDPATFEIPKEHDPLPRTQIDHLFATPGDVVGVSATRRDGVAGQIEFWVVYEGISKVDGETVKVWTADNGAPKAIDVPRHVANFDIWEYSTVSNKIVGPIHKTLEATVKTDLSAHGEYSKHHTDLESFEGRAGVLLTLNAVYSGNSDKNQAATCEFLTPLDEKVNGVGCYMTDGKTMEYILSQYISMSSAIKEKDLNADDKIFLNNIKTMMKYDSENPQGYAIVSISANSPCISKSGNC